MSAGNDSVVWRWVFAVTGACWLAALFGAWLARHGEPELGQTLILVFGSTGVALIVVSSILLLRRAYTRFRDRS